jgi:peptidoglycan hydrolase CwlO-like protein
MWYDTTNTIADAQWTLMGLQGYLGAMISKKPMPDAESKQMSDLISKANTEISQWNSKKQDLTNKLADIQSRIDYSAMSPGDADRARANMNGLRTLIEKGDTVTSQMKTTMDMINKYK